MTASKKLIQAAAGSAGGSFYDYEIDNSVRFNYGDSPKLTRTPPTPTDSKKFTYSVWIKRSVTNTVDGTDGAFMLGAAIDNTNYAHIHIRTDYFWYIDYNYSNTTSLHTYQKKLFRDTSAWYHVVVAVDTTQATATNRIKVYFNGEQYTDWNTGGNTYPAQNYVTRINNTILQTIGTGAQPAYSTWYYNGYLAEATFIDGQQLPATDFGETKNGVWIPKDVSGLTFGNSGFYLKFANSGALGTDSSGNGNNFTVTGLNSNDQMIDTPTNNFATQNPLDYQSPAVNFFEGNLAVQTNTASSGNGAGSTQSTIAIPSSGKWYAEFRQRSSGGYFGSGIGYPVVGITPQTGNVYSNGIGYVPDGSKYIASVLTSYGSSWSIGDVLGILVDVDNVSITFYKNGASQGAITSATHGFSSLAGWHFNTRDVASTEWIFFDYNYGQNGTFNGQTTAGGNSDANGIGNFKYTVPSGALALCTANLPEPTIGPNSATTSGEHFNTVLYTGTGSARTVTGVGFQPDWLWIKKRSAAENHALYDVLRGPTKRLESNNTNAEDAETAGVSSFDSDGFSIQGASDRSNTSGATYVAWNWKGNGSGVTNTDGSITSTVSANTDAGISIVKYTATGSAATVGHGLGVAPSVVIVKAATIGGNWSIYHKSNGAAYTLLFTTDGLYGPNSTWFNSTEPTSSVFSIGSGTGTNWYPYNFIAYCFAEVEGFSSFGKYTGNGSTDGPFVYTGFRPAWIMIKQTNTSGSSWNIQDTQRDPYNPRKYILYPDASSAESDWTAYPADILSNGFKIRYNGAGQNGSGSTYIYMAFAENPFKYANAR